MIPPGEAERCEDPAPSRPDAHRLWSLWDMLEKYAALFSQATTTLSEGKWICLQTARAGHDGELARQQIANLASHAIDQLREACTLAEMDNVFPELDRLAIAASLLLTHQEYTLETIGQSFKHLISRINDELQSKYFLRLERRDALLYAEEFPFGKEVSDKFPLATEDIEEATKCLALQRPTACVFHLMRAMEVVVKRLGKRLGVTNVEKEWGKILSDMAKAIERMPSDSVKKKAKKNEWSEAHVNLYHVKQAWRNETMHPKSNYTREQALEVFNATRVFMRHLAGLV